MGELKQKRKKPRQSLESVVANSLPQYTASKLRGMDETELRLAAQTAVQAGMKGKYLGDKYITGFFKEKLIEKIVKTLGGKSCRRLMARIERLARESTRCQ